AKTQACYRSSGSSPGSRASGSATSPTRTSCATAWCATSSAPTPRTPRAEMNLPSREQLRYHGVRWAWVPGLALLVYLAFPSSASNVAPLLEPGAVAEHEVIAPFTFPVNKSDQELAREAEELASTVKPIYEFQQRAFDSATIALHAFFAATQNAADQGGPQAVMRVAQEQRIVLSPGEAAYLAKGGKRRGLERALTDLFDRRLGLGVTPPGVLQVEQAPDLIIRRRSSETSVARDQVLSYAQYLARARRAHPDKGSSVGDAVYLRLAGHFYRPTLVLNTLETERRRDDLRRSVDPSKYIVRAGDRIVAAHEVVTNEAHEKLVALHNDLVRRGAATSRSVGGGVRPAAARLARPGHLLGAVGVLPPRDLPRVASGDAAREPVRAHAAPGRRGGALLAPAP